MRMCLIPILLLLTTTAGLADDVGEIPGATQVIGDLYRFDRFQQGLSESADLNGNQEVKHLAELRAEDADRRDRALKRIQREIGVEPDIGRAPSSVPYAETSDPEGPAYLRRFYAAQVAEYKAVVASIERYLQAPDHDRLRSFASEQLPILQSELKAAERTMVMAEE